MQNKHQKKICCGCPNLQGGGGSSRLGQNPKFVKGNKLLAPLMKMPDAGGVAPCLPEGSWLHKPPCLEWDEEPVSPGSGRLQYGMQVPKKCCI